MPALLIAAAAALPIIVILDALWLGVVMKDFYRTNLGHLMGSSVVWPAAILFYVVYAFGVAFFASMSADSLQKAALLGLALGALAYATYDLTNHAILKDWPLAVTVVDILWGAAITAVAASVGYLALHHG